MLKRIFLPIVLMGAVSLASAMHLEQPEVRYNSEKNSIIASLCIYKPDLSGYTVTEVTKCLNDDSFGVSGMEGEATSLSVSLPYFVKIEPYVVERLKKKIAEFERTLQK